MRLPRTSQLTPVAANPEMLLKQQQLLGLKAGSPRQQASVSARRARGRAPAVRVGEGA